MIRHQPLRVQVADHLRKEIISRYQPGDRLPTEAELAKRMGVSLLTLRDALATLAGDDLVVRQQGRGTFVGEGVLQAQGKVATGTRIALLVELDISHPRVSPYFVQLCQRIRLGLHERGHDARLYAGFVAPDAPAPMDTTSVELNQDVEEGSIGVVVAVASVPHMKIYQRLRDAGIPVVGDNPSFDYRIYASYPSRIDQSVERFLELGRKRIAAISYNGQDCDLLAKALKRHRLAVDEDWLVVGDHPLDEDAAYRPLTEIWNQDPKRKPDALFVGDDFYMPDVVRAVRDLGIAVPKDLAIIAHSNAGNRVQAPFPIDRVEINPQAVADLHIETVERILAGDTAIPTQQDLPFKLITADEAKRGG